LQFVFHITNVVQCSDDDVAVGVWQLIEELLTEISIEGGNLILIRNKRARRKNIFN